MDLIFIRHAQAQVRKPGQTAEEDTCRRLTQSGKKKFRKAAAGLGVLLSGTPPTRVWTSPIRRAKQTATLLHKAGFPQAEAKSFLADGTLSALIESIQTQPDDACLLLVGHEPHLSDWCQQLTGVSFPVQKGAAFAIRLTKGDPASGRLLWALHPRVLRRLSRYATKRYAAATDALPADFAAAIRDELAAAASLTDRLTRYPEEAETLHELRVHLRRVRTLVDFVRPLLKKKAASRMNGAVRGWLHETAPVREADILLEAGRAWAKNQQGKKARRLKRKLRRYRANCATNLPQAWTTAGPAIRTLADTGDSFRASRRSVDPEPYIQEAFVRQVACMNKRIRKARSGKSGACHALRIQIKQVRILMDLFDGLLPEGRPGEDWLARMQDTLGKYNDAGANMRLARVLLNKKDGRKRFSEALRKQRKKYRKKSLHLMQHTGTRSGPVEASADGAVRVGIIGVGNMGSNHARTLADGGVHGMVLAAVADTNPERIETIQGELPDTVRCFPSAEALLDSGVVDAVVIAVPHYDHPQLAIKAINRGLHALVEKPAGVYAKQVREMNETAMAHPDLVFGIMFNNRTNPLYIRMHDLIAAGELGDIKRTSWIITDWYRSQSYYDSGSWRATWSGEGGGVLLNQSPHNLDLWQWITGMMPIRIRAFCHEGKWHDIEVEDDVTAYAEYPNGATGTFITSTADAPGTNRFEVTGNRGKLIAENGELIFTRLDVPEREWNRTYTGGFGVPGSERIALDVSGPFPNHQGILQNFADAIRTGCPLLASGIEGIRSLELSNAMHLSSWLGRMVDVPVDEDLFHTMLMEKAASSQEKAAPETRLDLDGTYG